MSDQSATKPESEGIERSAGVEPKRQLAFPDRVARDNQVRSRIPLVAEAPVFEFEPVPRLEVAPRLPRRWRMRLRRLWSSRLAWFLAALALSIVLVTIVGIFSPQPKPPTPPVRR